jgi:AsmA protein
MATRSRFILIGVGVLVLLIVSAQVSIPLLLNADSFRTRIESTLSNTLDRKVNLGKLDFSLWSQSLVAREATVADDPAFSTQPFLRASLAKIRVQVIPLIFSHELRIKGFELVAPQITLLRAGNGAWNYANIGHPTAMTQGTQTQAASGIPGLAAGRLAGGYLDVRDGTLTVGSVPGGNASAPSIPNRVYEGLRFDAKGLSSTKSFPFTASARLPGAGGVSIRGTVGPIDAQDLSLTSFAVHIDLRHFNPGAAGLLDASSGVSGVIDRISIDAARSGHGLHIAKLLIDSPQLAIARAATRPASVPAVAPEGNGVMSALSADSVQVTRGVITVTTAGQPAGAAVYRQVELALANFSPTTSSSFTLTAQFAGGGSLITSGNAGPLNRQDVAGTPINAEISLKRVDVAASGWLPASSSIGGLLNLDATVASDGHMRNANGVADVAGLRLAKSGSPSPEPIDVRFAGTRNMQSYTGQLQHSTITLGGAVLNVQGNFQTVAATTQVNLKVDAPSTLIELLQPFLPAVGINLPAGSGLQGGTFNTSLNVTGPIDDPEISGPLQLDNTQLAGFNLGSNLSSISALAGLAPDSATAIRSLSVNLRVEHGVIHMDNLALVMPALGSATGSGTIGAGGALDYHVILKVGAVGRGGAGAGRAEGIVSEFLGMLSGGSRKSAGGLPANALRNGIPLAIGGTTSHPTFTPDFSGMLLNAHE